VISEQRANGELKASQRRAKSERTTSEKRVKKGPTTARRPDAEKPAGWQAFFFFPSKFRIPDWRCKSAKKDWVIFTIDVADTGVTSQVTFVRLDSFSTFGREGVNLQLELGDGRFAGTWWAAMEEPGGREKEPLRRGALRGTR
jgi:hypothetical protein